MAADLQAAASTTAIRYPARWKAKARTTLRPAAEDLVAEWPHLDVATLARHVADETEPTLPRQFCFTCNEGVSPNARTCALAPECGLGLGPVMSA
jgi:hypothetical protein